MGYSINFYNNDKAQKRDSYFANKPLFYTNGVDTNKVFFDYILDSFKKIRKQNKTNKIKILDLGTGTGYVPHTLSQLSDENFEIIGIDLARQMLDLAEKKNKDKRVKYLIADNISLPFENDSFDIVSNKLTTQFDFSELNRVLKPDGFFVFKEYDEAKGFREIYELFKIRYVKIHKKPADYYEKLNQLNFQEIILRKFSIKREYEIAEIKKIFEMASIIENFSDNDLDLIQHSLGAKFTITSDPFIIYAQK